MSYAAEMTAAIAPYDPADRSALRAFQLRHFGPSSRQADDRWFDWAFERNPHRLAGEPLVWVCKRDGVVVGQQACMPVLLKVGDLDRRASWGVDLMVAPEWRLRGVGPALFSHFERSSDILLGLGLSEPARRTCLRSAWVDLGPLPIFARPLDFQACVEGLGKRDWLKQAPNLLTSGTARIAAALASTTGCSLERIQTFDERVDNAWALASREYPMLVKRDFLRLRWRFDDAPDGSKYERYYLRRRGEVLGYAVTRMENWRGHQVARIVDCLSERRWVGALLAYIVDVMRTKNAVAVLLERLHPADGKRLLPIGFFRVGAATRFMVKSPPADAAARLLNNPACWIVTRGDSDSDLSANV